MFNADNELDKLFKEVTAIEPATEEELAQQTEPEFKSDYTNAELCKKLKNSPADPESSIEVVVYSEKRKSHRMQNIKRRNLIGRLVMVTNSRGHRTVGKCIAFDIRNGDPVIFLKNNIPAHATKPDLVFVVPV